MFNADDPEAVVISLLIAGISACVSQRDVFLDLWGTGKYGHNEGDEPRFYPGLNCIKAIAKHKNARDIYG